MSSFQNRDPYLPQNQLRGNSLQPHGILVSSGLQLRTFQSQLQVPSHAVIGHGTPGAFDFGDRQDSLLGGDNSHAEDTHPEVDILSYLGKPVV